MVGDLVTRLTFYRLRAAVEIVDRSDSLSVYVIWDGAPAETGDGVAYADPRLKALGHRLIAHSARDALKAWCDEAPADVYHAHRIALGVPEGGIDFPFGDTFPHEADYDQLAGVDFAKGCFVGQEVVSRMQHRGTARKRVVPVAGTGALVPGAEITADGRAIGTLGSVADGRALAMLRLDRVEKAVSEGKQLEAGGVALTLIQPDWADFTVPGTGGAASS